MIFETNLSNSSVAPSAVNAAGLRSCTRMIGLFESGSLSEHRLLSILEHLEDGSTELMCHPGHTDPKYAHWKFHWEDELQALTGERRAVVIHDPEQLVAIQRTGRLGVEILPLLLGLLLLLFCAEHLMSNFFYDAPDSAG